jgi:type I restriction enzyme S subunit
MNKFSDHDALYIPLDIHENMKRTWVKNGDVLINITGASIGRTTVYCGEDNKANVNQHVCIIRLKDFKTIDPFYLSYFLSSNSFQRHIVKINAGATRQALNFSQIGKFKIPIPSIKTQKKIVEMIKKAEKLKEYRAEADELADEYLNSLFSEMFGDMSNKNPKFPIKSLKDNIDILTGYAFKSKDFIEEGVPVIKIGTVNKGFFDIKTFSFLPSNFLNTHENYIIYRGDLLISLTGTTGKEDYGNVCFAENHEEKYLLNQRVAKISVNESIFNKYYLYFAFKHPAIKLELIKSNRGIRQANISKEDILKLKVPIPPLELQNQFAQIVQKVETLKTHQAQSKQEIDNLFNTLMQKAFKGELVC